MLTSFIYSISLLLIINPVDSVLKVNSELEETALIDSLISIGFNYAYSNPKIAYEFANEALNRSIKIQYTFGIAESKYLKASIDLNMGNYRVALDSSLKILNYYVQTGNMIKAAKTNKLIGDSYLRISEFDKAMESYNKAKQIIDNNKDTKFEKEFNLLLPHLLLSMGLIYNHREKFDDALDYFWKALNLSRKFNDVQLETAAYINIGLLHHEQDKFDSSLFYFRNAYNLAKSSNNQRFLATASNNIGEALHFLNRNDEAIKYLLEAYSIYEQYSDKNSIFRTLFVIAQIYSKSGDYENALKNLEISKELAKETGSKKELIPIYYQLSFVSEKLGKITDALAYYKLYSLYKDSIYDLEKEQLLAEMQANIKLEEEKNKNKINEIKLESQSRMLILLIIGLIITLILLFVIFYFLRNKIKINKTIAQQKEEIAKVNLELKELNATKDKFFSIIAHDINSPLAIITNVSDYLINNSDNISNKETNELIERIKITSQSLSNLLNNLLEWSKAQTGNIKFKPEKINLHNIVFEVTFIFRKNAADKGITIENNIDKNIEIIADKYMLEVILRNLISNALKFTPSNGKVSINAINVRNSLLISVEDTGIGIPEELIPKLFEIGENTTRFGTNNERGNGLGLILCKEFIEKHNGKIWVESQVGIGSKFIFTLNNSIN